MIIPTQRILYVLFCILIILFFSNHCHAQTIAEIRYRTMCLENEEIPVSSFTRTIFSFPMQQFSFLPLQEAFTDVDLYDDEELIPIENPLTNQRVVLIGDSQTSGAIGNTFENHFLHDYNAISFGRSGMRGWGFYRWNRHRDRIDRIITNNRPTIVLILLGGNDWSRSDRTDLEPTIENFWSYIRETASSHTSRQTAICWIESPTIIDAPGIRPHRETIQISNGREAIGNAIEETIGNNFFVGTSDIVITENRSEDGIHFNGRGAEAWYQAVFPRVEICIQNQRMQR